MAVPAVEERRSSSSEGVSEPSWAVRIADTMVDQGVEVAVYVPDSRLSGILVRLEQHGVLMRSMTREEECVAYCSGQRVAGRKAVLLMQSSGVGNALNALSTLALQYRLGMPMFISMRGTLGETNPSQISIGRATEALFAALGVQTFSLGRADEAEVLTEGVLTMSYAAEETAAILLESQLGGFNERR